MPSLFEAVILRSAKIKRSKSVLTVCAAVSHRGPALTNSYRTVTGTDEQKRILRKEGQS